MPIGSKTVVLLLCAALAGSAEGVAAVGAGTYRRECGGCHVAYPAEFLPQASWQKLLDGLDKHFGDSAEVLPEDRAAIEHYLSSHSYEQLRVKRRYGERFDTPGVPLRLTRSRYFLAIHHELSAREVEANPGVKTFARCQACHRGAERGSFDEDEVRIPR